MVRLRSTQAASGIAAALMALWVLAVAPSTAAAGPQPDPCVFVEPYRNPPPPALPPTGDLRRGESVATYCIAFFGHRHANGGVSNAKVEVRRYHVDSVAIARTEAQRELMPPTNAYGDVGFEGTRNGNPHIVVFTRHNYLAIIEVRSDFATWAKAEALKIDAAMKAAIGPPDPAGPSGASAGPSGGSAGPLDIGIGCAEDGVVLRCTASVPSVPPSAELSLEWTIDGVIQGSVGARMEVDLVAAGINAGEHLIAVTVTDDSTGQVSSRSQSMRTTAKVFAVNTPTCTVADDRGTFEIRCSTSAVNAPPGANVVFDWTVGGRTSEGTESIQRTLGQGVYGIGVSARDRASGRRTRVAATTVTVNPVGFLTNLLTGGQTSDPANVVDEVVGSALGAAALGAGAAIAGAFGAFGGLARGAGSGSGGSAPTGGGSRPGAGGAGSGRSPVPGDGGATPESVGDAAGDLLGAAAGDLPPLSTTPENIARWKQLTGWPDTERADVFFRAVMMEAIELGFTGPQTLELLRARAQAAWQDP